jgi:hypothetical protein
MLKVFQLLAEQPFTMRIMVFSDLAMGPLLFAERGFPSRHLCPL